MEQLGTDLMQPDGRVLAQMALAASVSAAHMAMPNHWLAFLLAGQAQRWGLAKTLSVTALGGVGHVGSTLLLSGVVTFVGRAFLSERVLTMFCSLALAILGGVYIRRWFTSRSLDHHGESGCCEEGLLHVHSEPTVGTNFPLELSLVLVPTLSPCVGTMPVIIDCFTSAQGFGSGFLVISAILLTTVGIMTGLVAAGYLGSSAVLDHRLLQKYDKLAIGLSFIGLAIISMVVPHHHSHPHTASMDHMEMDGLGGLHRDHFHQDHIHLHDQLSFVMQ